VNNPRIGIAQNLPQGATYDLSLIDFGIQLFPTGIITFDFGTEPRSVTGIQKLAQVYLKCLLTEKGSDLINPSYGTGFYAAMVGGNRPFSNSSQALAYVQQFIDDATQQVVSLTTGNDPASTLKSVTISSVVINSDALQIGLYLLSQAGIGASIAVPQPQLSMSTL
jgi:hypothetical protein